MNRVIIGTNQKALQINLDPVTYGTFAEIGAGQEVARWFFRVGGAAGTVAKSMSAYDMTFSDAIYGVTKRYVSRSRLVGMLDHEYGLLLERLDAKRGKNTRFFAFANTVAARGYKGTGECHGWMGIRFQHAPKAEPSQILMHVRMLDRDNLAQQEVLGIIGVNLCFGALTLHQDPNELLLSLMDSLTWERVEVDMIHFGGAAFKGVDNRLMALKLVQNWMTESAMFTADGHVVQASEVLYNKPVLVERGVFRPITRTAMDMMSCAVNQFVETTGTPESEMVVIMEMTLRGLSGQGGKIEHQDFLDRVDVLKSLGKHILISNYLRYFKLAQYLARYTRKTIVIPMGVPTLHRLFDAQYYTDMDGGIMEALGRMFTRDLKIYLYPTVDPVSGDLVDATRFIPPPNQQHLYRHLLDSGSIVDLKGADRTALSISTRDVQERLEKGDASWEQMVPAEVAALIKERKLFGYKG